MKKILILGVGNAQIDLIEYCKEKGFEVHGCSYQHGDSGEFLVDKFELLNITDIDKIKEYVLKNEIDYVYSVGSDIAMPSVTKVCKDLDLPCFISPDIAFICNEKNELRQFLGNDFVGNIRSQEISSKDDCVKLDFPLMLKPADAQGQRGVYKVNDIEEFKSLVDISLSHSRTKKAIVEEFIEGDEISVNTFSVNGECVFNLISDRIVWDEYPGGIIHKHIIPSKYDVKGVKEKIEDLVKRVLEKLGIQNGPAYFQIKIQNGLEPKLVEVTPRLDGCHMWRLINSYCDVNLLDLSMRLLEGQNISSNAFKLNIKRNRILTEFLCQAPESVVDREQFNTKDTIYYKWYYENGDKVKKMNGYMEKCGYKIFEE